MNNFSIFMLVVLFITLLTEPALALYDFEGIPLNIIAQGEVQGDLSTFGSYGLQDPPMRLSFSLDGEVQWARTYWGVWGGTPRYTGWTDLTVNGNQIQKITLYGSDDKNKQVFVSGYGVYWIACDTTSYLKNGENVIIANTSRFEPNNKLDGRIYALVTVVALKTQSGHSVKYLIAEGNENLHGEGWSGTNPTIHDRSTLLFSVNDREELQSANLSILLVATSRGQPDYVLLNGRDLGNDVNWPGYPRGVRDIGDEQSFNAGYHAPVDSRYVDAEIFDVRSLLKRGENNLTFLRGRDLDGDGTIATTGSLIEGEDYIHPVLVILTLGKGSTTGSGPDLMIDSIETRNAYAGVEGAIVLKVRNLGAYTGAAGEVKVWVGGELLERRQIQLERSGIQEVSIPWKAVEGTHQIKASVDIAGEADLSNNHREITVVVGTLPDLTVSLEHPYSPGSTVRQSGDLTLPLLSFAAVLIAGLIFFYRNGVSTLKLPILMLLCMVILSPAILQLHMVSPAEAASQTSLYLLPVIVSNTGGSDAPAFQLSVYLDDEQVSRKEYTDGMKKGQSERSEIPLFVIPGEHTVRVVVDEKGEVRDANRGNNAAEIKHLFA